MRTQQRKKYSAPARAIKRTARARQKTISATQARRRAARHVMACMFDDAPVRDGTEVNTGIYHLRSNDVWMVFPRCESGSDIIRAALVVAVCKRTGRILYLGPVNDEG